MATVLGISGSPRANGNTDDAVREALRVLEAERGVRTTFLRLADHRIERCRGCRACMELMDCAIRDDDFGRVWEQILAHDVVIFGAPVYWNSPPGVAKDFIDRTHAYYAHARPPLSGKTAGLLSVATLSGFESHEAACSSWLTSYGARVAGMVRVLACDAGEFARRQSEIEKVREFARSLPLD